MRGVAITGLGIVTALGRGVEAHEAALRRGESGLRALSLFPAPGLPESPTGEVSPAHLPQDPTLSRSEALALVAARDALGDAPLAGPGAIVVGTTTGGIHESERHYLLHRGAATPENRLALRHHPVGKIADRLAQRLSLEAEHHTFSTACSSSANAIGYAAMKIAAGAGWALAGGVDALCRITYLGFHSLKLLAPHCRPFDQGRLGLALGEGAAFLRLEPGAAARARGAPIYGFVQGWGCTADAHHMTAPHPEGKGAIAAMQAALADAGRTPGDVGYVNAHGTATPANDRSESLALRAVFGAAVPPVSSTKGATGHTLGAAGAVEALLCALALSRGWAPGNLGLVQQDPDCQVPLIPAQGLSGPLQVALSNSFGFGGNNAALVLAREEP